MKDKDTAPAETQRPGTRVTQAGRDPAAQYGFVNPPVYHGSTVLHPDVATMKGHKQRYAYGRRGSPTIDALTDAMTELERADGCVLTPSGLSAVTLSLLSVLEAGDHLLMVDSVYRPTRHFCDAVLVKLGIAVEYYDPLVGGDIAGLMRPTTKAVFTEAPGSHTFEMQDIGAIADAAHAGGALVLMDNTWASPLFFQPLEHGADISIQAGTKYIVGHSDVMLGTAAAKGRAWGKLKAMHGALGLTVGPDDVYLALRGLRTLSVRLARHMESTLRIARWLEARPEVARILYPALESDPGHAIWKRDFTGASGLFGVILADATTREADAFLDALTLFGLGYSWGGFESLAIPCAPNDYRTATTWSAEGALIRLHVGLEDADDLIADLERALVRMKESAPA